jgi:hypothetical protein
MLHLVDLEDRDGIVRRVLDDVADSRGAGHVASEQDLVEGNEADERDLRQPLSELALADVELPCELVVVGRAPQLVLELRVGTLDSPGLGAQKRDPIDRAELVDDRALDAAIA